ncbi:hypothetical protein [Naumannella cuiyingiana]|uniref:Putative MFS family arabinose efflux permease n=1 Tax=Naumannella cuiyingiana TaxID=1347891 RepID=A0A7Z0D879_9ACTN|nr:hypothetical protein [Naumannella cuiyingiana]NYI70620.1 putative MFS family arabinose efflux permease [Naumannella cuiyingiana]
MRDTYPLRLFGALGLIALGAALATILGKWLTGPAGQVFLFGGIAIAVAGCLLLLATMIRPRHPDGPAQPGDSPRPRDRSR